MGRLEIDFKAELHNFYSSDILLEGPDGGDMVLFGSVPNIGYFHSTSGLYGDKDWGNLHNFTVRMSYLQRQGYKIRSVRFRQENSETPKYLEGVECAIPHPEKKFWVLCNSSREVMFLIPDEEVIGVMSSGVKLEGLENIL